MDNIASNFVIYTAMACAEDTAASSDSSEDIPVHDQASVSLACPEAQRGNTGLSELRLKCEENRWITPDVSCGGGLLFIIIMLNCLYTPCPHPHML